METDVCLQKGYLEKLACQLPWLLGFCPFNTDALMMGHFTDWLFALPESSFRRYPYGWLLSEDCPPLLNGNPSFLSLPFPTPSLGLTICIFPACIAFYDARQAYSYDAYCLSLSDKI